MTDILEVEQHFEQHKSRRAKAVAEMLAEWDGFDYWEYVKEKLANVKTLPELDEAAMALVRESAYHDTLRPKTWLSRVGSGEYKSAEVMHVKQWIISQHYLSKHKQLESGAA
jgi:hypothetical protein